MLGVGPAGPDGADANREADSPASTVAPQRPVLGTPPEQRDALAVLLSVTGLGPLTLQRLVEATGSPAAILGLARQPGGPGRLLDASRGADGTGQAMHRAVADGIVAAERRAGAIVRETDRLAIRIVTPADQDYPRRLLAIEVPPPALFVRGSLEPLSSRNVIAVVGTRRPSPGGRRISSRLAAALARAGAVVVSGLAVGIDGAAHAAVIAERAHTVAFIGGGHARLFPRAHDRLADAIVDSGGAVISEYAPYAEPTKGTFPQRNRLISGASDAVVVVEAGARSGALVTASWALEQGRDCYLVPGSIDAPTSAGCNGFLRDWPEVTRIVSGIPQLLDDLGLLAEAAFSAVPAPAAAAAAAAANGLRSTVRAASAAAMLSNSSAADRGVAEALVEGAVTVDELVSVTRLSVGAVLGAVTRLEAIGLVRANHGRYEPAGPLATAA